jgi:hexulose-6-phosphate isomerase
MIKGISYWSMKEGMAGTHSIEAALADAKAAGFDGLELAIATEGALTTDATEAECAEIRKKIDASGVIVKTTASGVAWGLSPTSNDPDVRAKSNELYARMLQITAWLGCEALLYLPAVVRSPICPDECVRYDTAIERAHENIKQLGDVAQKVGVDLCIENVWNGFLLSPLEFAQFIDDCDNDRVGVYFDVGNLLGYHQHTPHWIEMLGARIKRVHIKDFKEEFDWKGGYHFCRLLEGDMAWPETMAALRAIGYDKTMIGELMPWDAKLLDDTSAAMDRILAM